MILKRKRVLFKVIAVCLPVLFFAGLELAFRSFNIGRDLKLFLPYSHDENFLTVNPDVSSRFYVQEENAVKGTEDLFFKEKKTNSFRVFVLGESTALGFPFRHHLSFPSMLRVRLQESFPDKLIEVVNLSLTGINSYALVEFSDEVIEQKPDAIIIAAGHNEYYGALGVASSSSLGSNPKLVRGAIGLRKLRIVQLASNFWINFKEKLQPRSIDLTKNLMEMMVSKKEIPLDGALYRKGLDQFEENVEISLKKFQKRQIPVLFVESISNERDQYPFLSQTKNPQIQEQIASDIHHLKLLAHSEDKITGLHRLVDADDTYAEIHYLLGRAYLETDDTELAKEHFFKAKEFDALRFRAPEEINNIAQNLCGQTGATFIPIREVLESLTQDKLMGDDFFMEHLHPNIEGHFIIADVLYEKIMDLAKAKFLNYKMIDSIQAKALFPLNEVDSLYGVYTTTILKEGWPFNETIHLEEKWDKSMEEALAGGLAVRQITWDDAMDKLYRYYVSEGEFEKAYNVAETVAMAYPYQLPYQKKAGQLAASLERWERVAFYFKAANHIQPDPDNLRNIVQGLLKSSRLSEAIPYLISIKNENPTDKTFDRMLITVQEIVKLEFKLETTTQITAQDYQRLAENYLLLGNLEIAKKYANHLLDENPQNSAGQLILKKIESRLES